MMDLASDRIAEIAPVTGADFWHDLKLRLNPTQHFALTQRHLDLLVLIANGHGLKTAAHKMGISRRTAEIHSMRVQEKLGASSLAHAVAIAFRNGILS